MMNNVAMNNNKGFSLMELAVIITILGLILAPFFNFLAQSHRKEQLITLEERNNRIVAAISAYVTENGRYPCPANYALSPTDADFGVEERNIISGVCVSSGNNVVSGSGILYGYLPVLTLKLPLEDAVNVYGWKYLYAVSENASTAVDGTGNITVEFDNNQDGTANGAGDSGTGMVASLGSLPFVVVDPGKDGKGSATLNGVVSGLVSDFFGCTGASAANDIENCDQDNTFHSMDWRVMSDPNNTAYYDDTVLFSLIRNDSTFWEISTVSGGNINVSLRGDGSLVIGDSPSGANSQHKLQLYGGNLRTRDGSDGAVSAGNGILQASEKIEVERDLRANEVSADNVGAIEGYFYAPKKDESGTP